MGESPPSTADRSKVFKVWHSFNYFFGGGTFLIGSVMLFPEFADFFDTNTVSAWLYSFGSFTFLIADTSEWIHYTYRDCRYLSYSINYLLSVVASWLYLIGSILFIPVL
jgi:hypothetical protein